MDEYKKCPKYEDGTAYSEGNSVICLMGRGNCPYDNIVDKNQYEGHAILGKGNKVGIICTTHGKVKVKDLEKITKP